MRFLKNIFNKLSKFRWYSEQDTELSYFSSALDSALAISVLVLLMSIKESDWINITWGSYLGSIFFGGVLGGFVCYWRVKNGTINNWGFWLNLSKSNSFKILVLLVFITPLLVSAIQFLGYSFEFGLRFYVYWLMGLMFFILTSLIGFLSPKVYRYRDFSHFIEVSGSFMHLSLESKEVRESLIRKKENKSLAKHEEWKLDEHLEVLKSIENNEIHNKEECFDVLRIRAAHGYTYRKRVVASVFMIFFLLLLSVVISDFGFMLEEVYKEFSKHDSVLKSIYRFK